MPTNESSAKKSDSTLKILVLVGVFLIISVLSLWYLQQRSPGSTSTTNSSTSSSSKTTYTSNTLGYSLSYPSSWSKEETSDTTADGTSYKIVLLNRTEKEPPMNGKPNLMIYEKFTDDICENSDSCKSESVTYNNKSATKYTQIATGWTIYKFDNDLLVFAFPNGDDAAIEEVLKTINY